MARKTIEKQFADAKKAYEKQLKTIGDELAKSLVEMIAKLIPKGWYLMWNQSDDQYNDEDTYFGLDSELLVSERVPRQGALIKAEVPRTYRTEKLSWGGTTKVIDDYGSPAEYEWHLDDKCKKRKVGDEGYEEPGVLSLDDAEAELGLDDDAFETLRYTFQEIDKDDFQRAFGDKATVRVYSDGTYKID